MCGAGPVGKEDFGRLPEEFSEDSVATDRTSFAPGEGRRAVYANVIVQRESTRPAAGGNMFRMRNPGMAARVKVAKSTSRA